MRILITGAAGFVGSTLAHTWVDAGAPHTLFGLDNFSRAGSEGNRLALRRRGVRLTHGDVRLPSDVEALPDVDWVIDASANPSVLAGTGGDANSRQLIEHNLLGTVNVLEYCRARRAGLILLSTSRVYSIAALAGLPVVAGDGGYQLAGTGELGVSVRGLTEAFSTAAPRSLYGTSKVASEDLALEYADAFGVPVWINRCGVLAGAGQFGRPDQGIFSYWIHSWMARRPLAYLGFDGLGHQVRDCLHPRDLVPLLERQMQHAGAALPPIVNVSGGAASACSLRQCSEWCTSRFGNHPVSSRAEPRRYDVPWLVLDSAAAATHWGWSPATSRAATFEEIAVFAEQHPEWLDVSQA